MEVWFTVEAAVWKRNGSCEYDGERIHSAVKLAHSDEVPAPIVTDVGASRELG